MECEAQSANNQSKLSKKTPCPQPVEKKTGGLRSLFSFFRGSAHRRGLGSDRSDGDQDSSRSKRGQLGSSFSTQSLPARRPSTTASEPLPGILSDSVETLHAQIRPPFSHRPSSSSSSCSSYGSETSSTPGTTPSNSSSSSLRSGELLGGARSNASLKKRASESYRTAPSPLSTVTAAKNYPYILPHQMRAPEHDYSHHESKQPVKRKNSISRIMSMRRAQSTPDLSGDGFQGSPFPRPRSSSSKRKSTSLPTEYTIQEKLDHKAILGADPAGGGFYRYPGAENENIRRAGPRPGFRRPPGPDQWKRNSWAGLDDNGGIDPAHLGVNGRRGMRRDPRPGGLPGFRRNVASEVILEESSDADPLSPDRRRFSELPSPTSAWCNGGPQVQGAPPVPSVPAGFAQRSTPTLSSTESSATLDTPASSAVSSLHEGETTPTGREDVRLSFSLEATSDVPVMQKLRSEATKLVTALASEETKLRTLQPENCVSTMQVPMIKVVQLSPPYAAFANRLFSNEGR